MNSDEPTLCALCQRPLGGRVERHHLIPRSFGGRETIWVHAICHRAIHQAASNAELARLYNTPERLRDHPDLKKFINWVAKRPPDFYRRTRQRRS